jgi:hypothetical protein
MAVYKKCVRFCLPRDTCGDIIAHPSWQASIEGSSKPNFMEVSRQHWLEEGSSELSEANLVWPDEESSKESSLGFQWPQGVQPWLLDHGTVYGLQCSLLSYN